MDKPSDILHRAAEYLIEHGHAKATFQAPDESVCVVGAITKSHLANCLQVRTRFDIAAINEAMRFLALVVGTAPMGWNDRDETTEAMAIGALHEAAILAKEAGE